MKLFIAACLFAVSLAQTEAACGYRYELVRENSICAGDEEGRYEGEDDGITSLQVCLQTCIDDSAGTPGTSAGVQFFAFKPSNKECRCYKASVTTCEASTSTVLGGFNAYKVTGEACADTTKKKKYRLAWPLV
eukprot:TRINITY_DN2102_c1_g1_i1.p1 TRINITY_DN2102_c1_g1~~TRINITY_DN2102_c1_g1_i1.p1  ORF type:complete len:133 (+),score=20.91 TRINITY_DN2102_c1_g1_i1:128-526(+)